MSHVFLRRGATWRRVLVAPVALSLLASMLLATPVAATGELTWADQFGPVGQGVAATPDAVYVVAGRAHPSAGGAHLSKYLHSGMRQWDVTLAARTTMEAVVADGSAVYVSGTTFAALPGQPDPHGQFQFFIARYSLAGALVWARQFLPPATVAPQGEPSTHLAVTTAGAFIAGDGRATSFLRMYDHDGNSRWTQNVPAHMETMTADATGAVVVSSWYTPLSTGTMRMFDNAGAIRFTRVVPGVGGFHMAAAAPGGGFYIGYEHFNGYLTLYNRDGFVIRTLRIRDRFMDWGGITAVSGRLYVAWRAYNGTGGQVARWAALSPTTGAVFWRHDLALGRGSRFDPRSIAVVPQGGYIAGRVLGVSADPTELFTGFLMRFTIDTSPPNIFESGYALPPRVPLTIDDFTLEGSWKASDDISGVGRVQLQESSDGTTWNDVLLPEPKATSALIDVKPNGPHRFRVRAIDRSGNVGKWRVSKLYQTDLLQETDADATYDADWKPATAAGANGGSVMSTSKAGATAKLTFTGDAFGLVSTRGPKRGALDIYLDGVKLKTLDLYADDAAPNVMVFARNFSSVGTHLVTLVARGTPGRPAVDIDAFEILSTSP